MRLLVGCIILTISAKASGAGIDPDQVQLVEKQPKGCNLVGKVSVDIARLLPALKADGIGRRAAKKARNEIEDAKQSAASLGADTLVIPPSNANAQLLQGSLPAYRCRQGAAAAMVRNSQAERAGKRFSFVGEVIGVATPMGLGSGVTLSKFMATDSLVELNVALASDAYSVNQTYGIESSDYGSYDMTKEGASSLISLRYKMFVTNSFYWHAGAGYRHTKATLYATSKTSDEKTKIANLAVTDVGPGFGIGNQWQWSGFTIGCDWIGLYLPAIYLKRDYDVDGQTVVSASSTESNRESFKKHHEGMHAQVVRFYFGSSL